MRMSFAHFIKKKKPKRLSMVNVVQYDAVKGSSRFFSFHPRPISLRGLCMWFPQYVPHGQTNSMSPQKSIYFDVHMRTNPGITSHSLRFTQHCILDQTFTVPIWASIYLFKCSNVRMFECLNIIYLCVCRYLCIFHFFCQILKLCIHCIMHGWQCVRGQKRSVLRWLPW